jgi:hypothetical protein
MIIYMDRNEVFAHTLWPLCVCLKTSEILREVILDTAWIVIIGHFLPIIRFTYRVTSQVRTGPLARLARRFASSRHGNIQICGTFDLGSRKQKFLTYNQGASPIRC